MSSSQQQPSLVPEQDKKFYANTSIPKYFCCPLTFEVMVDPVVDHQGNTFERKAIEQALDKGQNRSPISREKINKNGLIPNTALQKAIHEFMGPNWSAKHPIESTKRQLEAHPNPSKKVAHTSRNRKIIDVHLDRISRSVGKCIQLDSNGVAAFTYEELTIVVEVPADRGTFYIYTCENVPQLEPAVRDEMLKLNYLQQETRGGVFSVRKTGSEESEFEIMFAYNDRTDAISAVDFRNILENFIDTALDLRKRLSNPSLPPPVTTTVGSQPYTKQL